MMKWSHVTPIAISATILALVLLLILKRCFLRTKRNQNDVVRVQSLQNGIAKLHQVSPHHHHPHHYDVENPKKPTTASGYYLSRRVPSTNNPPFSWAHHPSSITDAVENGWSRFAFTTFVSSSSSSSSVKSARALFGACATGGDSDNETTNVEIGWEVCEGSVDFMQKIRLNPDSRKTNNNNSNISVIRAALPLPGPNLGNSSFPQEAYFEITVLSCSKNEYDRLEEEEKRGKSDGDQIKLIGEDFNAKNNPSGHSERRTRIDKDGVRAGKQDGENDGVLVCVGLTGGGPPALRAPGRYQGSIGFTSTGSVYLDGTKLIFESEKNEWATSNKVIGCGYNPSQKKVLFTVDAHLVHEIHCKTEDFSSPLYPTLASNNEITVLVNLGQSPFKYSPANMQRTPNPCFVGPLGTSAALGYEEDSRELFSMGRIDSQWLQRSANRSNNNTVNSIRALEYDQESDGDLFEIVLDSNGRSPYATLY